MPNKIKDIEIVRFFFRNSKGIKAAASHFGVPKSYAGKVISQYIKKHNIRY